MQLVNHSSRATRLRHTVLKPSYQKGMVSRYQVLSVIQHLREDRGIQHICWTHWAHQSCTHLLLTKCYS